jgi:predicted nuclease of predicted toxin-antitoxin system
MKFIVDAQLPYYLAKFRKNQGHDVIHANDLPNEDRSSDYEIRNIADEENRIVISKDSDFIDTYLLFNSPNKLLLVTTGNIKNKDLITLFELNLRELLFLFENYSFVEMSNTEIIIHE